MSLWRDMVTEMGDWLQTGRLIKCVSIFQENKRQVFIIGEDGYEYEKEEK